MIELALAWLYHAMESFFGFLSSFIVFGDLSYLSLVIGISVVSLIVVNFIPRG